MYARNKIRTKNDEGYESNLYIYNIKSIPRIVMGHSTHGAALDVSFARHVGILYVFIVQRR